MENRLRRVLARRGYRLEKSRRRDQQAIDYGGYMIIETSTNSAILGASPHPYSATLDEVSKWVAG